MAEPEGARDGRGTRSGFTMVEIAISLGVIAIALVAIIGVLPTGLRVQQQNLEDTLLNQDGKLWLETIRAGSIGLDYLTNYVVEIRVTNNPPSGPMAVFTSRPDNRPNHYYFLTNGLNIVGLLTTPKYHYDPLRRTVITNRLTAIVRSISGSALDQSTIGRELSFTYFLRPEIVPFTLYPTNYTNFTLSNISLEERLTRSNRWLMARNAATNFSELRLTLTGPAYQRGPQLEWQAYGTPRVFRTVMPGGLAAFESADKRTPDLYIVQQEQFRRVMP